MWKLFNKEVDLWEPTSFLDHVYLGCTQRQCEISKDIMDTYRTMWESRISTGGTEQLQCLEIFRISSWSHVMEGHAKKCLERYCELANKTTQQLYEVSSPLCIFGSHTFVPIRWMCKKQNSVSHSSTESEIISLDAGLRLNGVLALDLWDLIVLVLGNTIQTHDRTVKPVVIWQKSRTKAISRNDQRFE